MATLADEISLCDALWATLMQANALDGTLHPYEGHGTYGAIKDALILALTLTFGSNGPVARDMARVVYGACIESGEAPSVQWRRIRASGD